MGHEWDTTVEHRTNRKHGCPYCSKRKFLIQCVETGMIFPSYKDAAQYCGLAGGAYIADCCKGKQKTAGGYHWKYVNEEDSEHGTE